MDTARFGGNMNENCFSTWRTPSPQQMNGHSLTSSPALNSSSQSSSRETSPTFLGQHDFQRAPSPRPSSPAVTMSNGYRGQPYENVKSFNNQQRDQKPYPPWRRVSSTSTNFAPQGLQQSAQHSNLSYGMNNISITDTSEIEDRDNEQKVALVDRSSIIDFWMKSRQILWDEPTCSLPAKEFARKYMERFNQTPNLDVLKKDLQEYMQIQGDVVNGVVQLVPVQVFVRDLLILLKEAGGRMLLINFESSYLNRFGVACRPASLGFPNSTALVQSLGDYVLMKGKRMKRIIVLNRDQVPELPNYSPPVPVQSQPETREQYFNYPYNPVPPPPHVQNKGVPPLPHMQNKGVPPPPSPTSPFDHKRHIGNTDMQTSHLIMGLTPPPQQTYQPPSPVLYSGSPVAPNGSVLWGQVWSPQYSVMPPLSPAHYMMPTIPINWGNVPSPPMLNQQTKPGNNTTVCGRAPVSIQTLEQFGKGVPPKPSELPSPELLTGNGVAAEGFFTNGDCSQTTPSKSHAKKRLAAQFDTQQ